MWFLEARIDSGRELRQLARRYRGLAAQTGDTITRQVTGRLARALEARAALLWSDGLSLARWSEPGPQAANDNFPG